MTTAIGVLCARVRVEEKQIITALGDAGAVAMPVPPAGLPLPPCPAPQDVAALGTDRELAHAGNIAPAVIIDRAANRAVATAMLSLLKRARIETLDAGLAATGSRLDIASALSAAGLPRPASLIAFSEATGTGAAASMGFPATLLPMTPGSAPTTLLDGDTADAVIEHRIVLGSQSEAVVLIQAGAPSAAELTRLHLVDGDVRAFEGAAPSARAIDIARRAAAVLGADVVTIDIAFPDGACVIWDVLPVADFRQGTSLGAISIGEALATLAMKRAGRQSRASGWEEGSHVIALTA